MALTEKVRASKTICFQRSIDYFIEIGLSKENPIKYSEVTVR